MITIIGIIPARYQSTRFPGKPIALIGDTPMIEWVYRQAKKAKSIQDVWIATDDERILEYCNKFTSNVVMTESTHLNGTSRCSEALSKIPLKPDYVINIQGDEPFVNPKDINLLCRAIIDNEIATLASRLKEDQKDDFNAVKILVDNELNAVLFSRKHQENTPFKVFRHLGLYAFKTEVLNKIVTLSPSPNEKLESLEQLRWLDHGYNVKVEITDTESISVDIPEDIHRAEIYLKRNVI